jgi:hypothetical protein
VYYSKKTRGNYFGEKYMIWVLYIITGLSNPSLQQVAVYSDEQVCKKVSEDLVTKNVRSVCIPKEKNI